MLICYDYTDGSGGTRSARELCTGGVARNLLRGDKRGDLGVSRSMLNIRLNKAIDRHKWRTVQSPIIL